MPTLNKKKIINDPVYGFIKVPFDFLYDIIQHPSFQRLRRVKQLGMTHIVYPGAMHTRFQHALGAMHLMSSAVETLRSKGQEITEEESEAVHAAILLHDIGHGPFSHVLESTLISNISHEDISLFFMQRINKDMNGRLDMAISIFKNEYKKKFLHQLVSSQLDMDRLDYLRRDSFFSGVTEGMIGSDRIIKMLDVYDDHLVVEAKGIYSIEKFLVARRLMYWQVYLHKTALSAEQMLIKIMQRARTLVQSGHELFAPANFLYFLKHQPGIEEFEGDERVLEYFALMDDDDIMSSIKAWTVHPDKILATLSASFINRSLYRIEITRDPIPADRIIEIKTKVLREYGLRSEEELSYFVFADTIAINAYNVKDDRIHIRFKEDEIKDISEASDMLDLSALGKTVLKYYLCYPKGLE